jgi:hypothetical protein
MYEKPCYMPSERYLPGQAFPNGIRSVRGDVVKYGDANRCYAVRSSLAQEDSAVNGRIKLSGKPAGAGIFVWLSVMGIKHGVPGIPHFSFLEFLR